LTTVPSGAITRIGRIRRRSRARLLGASSERRRSKPKSDASTAFTALALRIAAVNRWSDEAFVVRFRRSLFAGREALAIRRGKARLYADGYCYADGMVSTPSSSRNLRLGIRRAGWCAGRRASFPRNRQADRGGSLGAGDSVALADFAKALGSSLAGAICAPGRLRVLRECARCSAAGLVCLRRFSTAHDFDGGNAQAFLVNFAAGPMEPGNVPQHRRGERGWRRRNQACHAWLPSHTPASPA